MKILLLLVGVFLAEFCWSWLTDMSLVSVVGCKPLGAGAFNAASQALAYSVLRCLSKRQFGWIYIMAAIAGSTTGTILVALR